MEILKIKKKRSLSICDAARLVSEGDAATDVDLLPENFFFWKKVRKIYAVSDHRYGVGREYTLC